jgi:hypothetical protein
MQKAAVQVARQQHPAPGCHRPQQRRLEKATGAIQPIPTVVGPHFRRHPPLGGGHRPLGQQGAAQCR